MILIDLVKRLSVIVCVINALCILSEDQLLFPCIIKAALLIGDAILYRKHTVCIIIVCSSQIGRYMATIRPPTKMPKTAMIMGSRRDVRLSTKLSTASS